MSFGGRRGSWQPPQWRDLTDEEVRELLPELVQSGMGLGAFARWKEVHRRALADGIKRVAPDTYDELVEKGVIGQQADRGKSGTKLETSARQMLGRKKAGEWVVFAAHGSHGVADLVALRPGCPALLIQAKKDGKLGPDEWNELVSLAERAGGWPVLVRRPEGQTTGAEWYRLTGPRPKGSRLADYLVPFDPANPEQGDLLASPGALSRLEDALVGT